MSYDKNKAHAIYVYKYYEERKKQKSELQEIDKDFSNRNMIKSGTYITACIDIYAGHLLYNTDLFINTLLESLYNSQINKKIQIKLIDDLNSFINNESKRKNDLLNQKIIQLNLSKYGNTSISLSDLNQKFGEIRTNKLVQLKNMIEQHNQKVSLEKRKIGFWRTKIRTVVEIIGGVVGIITILGLLSHYNNESTKLPAIKKYNIQPAEISIGKPINMVWEVDNADSVVINNMIGKVPLSNSKIVYPKETTEYSLSAYLNNISITVSKKIIVKNQR